MWEEDNQDWWYRRDEDDEEGKEVDREYEDLLPAPEYRHIVESGQQFTHWLASGYGFLHFLGKLGSGKSVLMKYLFNHLRTYAEL